MKVATIGFFDGVHSGHRFLIDHTKALAKERSAQSVVVTFKDHPAEVLGRAKGLKLLTLPDEKLERLNEIQTDEVMVLEFDRQLARMSAYSFMKDILMARMNVTTLVIGYDHSFGSSDGGHDYEEYGRELGIEIVKAPAYGQVSSSLIRSMLGKGHVEEANSILGYRYGFSGVVVTGKQLGRTIGFPTANLETSNKKLMPKVGAYEVKVQFGGEWLTGMMNIGNDAVEVHILNFDGNLYGRTLRVEIVRMIREEMVFRNTDELKRQLEIDCKWILKR